jgi:hypothetical protein
MKMIVCYNASDNHKVMTTLILVVLILFFVGIHKIVTLSGFVNFYLQSHNPHSKVVAEVTIGHSISTWKLLEPYLCLPSHMHLTHTILVIPLLETLTSWPSKQKVMP